MPLSETTKISRDWLAGFAERREDAVFREDNELGEISLNQDASHRSVGRLG